MEKLSISVGRVLIGLYFLYPGITKIPRFEFMVDYMNLHNIAFVGILLPITIFLQIILGSMLIIGYRIKESALILAGLTLCINFSMHDFWNDYPEVNSAHELQNFIKNLGIFAGLLILSSSSGIQQWKLLRK